MSQNIDMKELRELPLKWRIMAGAAPTEAEAAVLRHCAGTLEEKLLCPICPTTRDLALNAKRMGKPWENVHCACGRVFKVP